MQYHQRNQKPQQFPLFLPLLPLFLKGLMYVSAQESKSLSSTSVSARACMARLK